MRTETTVFKNVSFFEGPEKRVQIRFTPDLPFSLFSVPDAFWTECLSLAGCQVLSKMSNGDIKAFVLSESSFFLSKDEILIKTCGQTTLIEFAEHFFRRYPSSRAHLAFFSYSHPPFIDPQSQPEVHTEVDAEMARLSALIPEGRVEDSPEWSFFFYEKQAGGESSDDRLGVMEVACYDLPRELRKVFFKEDGMTYERISERLKLGLFFPDFVVDHYCFDPCGFSCNGIRGKEYFTIHVTPEKEFSYLSVETNCGEFSAGEFVRALEHKRGKSILFDAKRRKSVVMYGCKCEA